MLLLYISYLHSGLDAMLVIGIVFWFDGLVVNDIVHEAASKALH